MSTRNTKSRYKIGVIGCGYAGMVYVITQIRHARVPLDIDIFEKGQPGGVAYGKDQSESVHNQNLQAGRVSVLREDPTHFVRWANNKGLKLHEASPVSRHLFGEYCWDTMWVEAKKAEMIVSLRIINAEIISFEEDAQGRSILKNNGDMYVKDSKNKKQFESSLIYDSLVLANGHLEIKSPKALSDFKENISNIIIDQYTQSAHDIFDTFVERCTPESKVVVLGSGLAAMDVPVSIVKRCEALKKEPPHFIFVSRRGNMHPIYSGEHRHVSIWLKRPELLDRDIITYKQFMEELPVIIKSAKAEVYAQDTKALNANPDLLWERILKGMEPYIAELMTKMSSRDFRKIHDNYGSLITSYRIGLEKHVGDVIVALKKESKMENTVGDVTACNPGKVTVLSADKEITINSDLIVNAIGRNRNYKDTQSIFWNNIDFQSHRMTGIGVQTTEKFKLVREDGTPYLNVHCLGPMVAGVQMEKFGRTGAFTESQGPTKSTAITIVEQKSRNMSNPSSEVVRFFESIDSVTDIKDLLFETLQKELGTEESEVFRSTYDKYYEERLSLLRKKFLKHLYAERYSMNPVDVLFELNQDVEVYIAGLGEGKDTYLGKKISQKHLDLISRMNILLLEIVISQGLKKCGDIRFDPQTIEEGVTR